MRNDNVLTLSELLGVLERIHAEHGDGPVAIWDADTGWEMLISDVVRSADGHYLLDGGGYDDVWVIGRPEKPAIKLWSAPDPDGSTRD